MLHAFADGRLLLVVLVAPWCDKGNDFVKKELALAADMIDETFASHLPSLDSSLPTTARKIPMPNPMGIARVSYSKI